MLHQRTTGLIDLEPFLFLAVERLHRGHDHHGAGIQCGAGQRFGLVEVEHGCRARLGQRGMQGAVAILQLLQGLVADGLGRRKPQQHAVFGLEQMFVNERHAFCRKPGLAAASGDAEAEVRHVRCEAFDAVVGQAAVPQLFGGRGEGEAGIAECVAVAEVRQDAVQRALLVLLGDESTQGVTSSA